MRPRFGKLRQLFSAANENRLLPNRRPLRVEPLEGRWLLSVGTLLVDIDSPAGTPDGQAWETAYPDLQEALDQAATLNTDAVPENDITQIWIAEGTYKPTAQLDPADPRTATFSMLDNVSLYGGFYGDEVDLASRQGNETILSGDLDADGTLSDDDAYHVVYADNVTDVTIDTLTITGGYAYYPRTGGGINNSGTLTIIDSTISDNLASNDGGGIYNSGTMTVIGSTISGNTARSSSGGGICSSEGTLTVVGSRILGNWSQHYGGGIHIYSGSATITNSAIFDNLASWYGGGIHNTSGTLTVTGSTISGNSGYEGGGISNDDGTLVFTNSIVAKNVARSAPDIRGMLSFGSGYNVIGIWSGETAPPGSRNFRGTQEEPLDPGLSHWTEVGEGVWGYLLLPDSPAIDAGSNARAVDAAGVPLQTDIYGNSRIQNEIVDIGAVEGASVPTDAVTYIVQSLVDSIAEDGILTFREAFLAANSNQPAADAAGGSFDQQDRIEFSNGVTGTVLLDSQELTIYGDLAIQGPHADLLTFDGQGASRVFKIVPGTEVALSGVTITAGYNGIYSLGTLTITDSTIAENFGTGIFPSYGTLVIENSTISNNEGSGINGSGTLAITNSTISRNSGLGIGSRSGTTSVESSTISENENGGIQNSPDVMTVSNSTISGNSRDHHGAGIYNPGTLTITGSTISGNSTNNMHYDGGGLFSYRADTVTIINSTISGNSARSGGGIYSDRVEGLIIVNSIIADNTASTYPDIDGTLSAGSDYNLIGVWNGDSDPPGAHNLTGEQDAPIDPRFVRAPSDGGDGWGDDPDTTDIDEGVNDDFGDLRLLPGSPAIDAGDDAWAVDADGNPLVTDLDGKPRISGQRVDMGAFEYLWTLYWDEAGPGSWSDPARWVDAVGGQVTFFPNNAGTAAVVREDVVNVPSDTEVYSLRVESGQVRVEVGQTLTIAGELSVPDVSLAGSEGVIVGEGSVALGVGSSLSLSAGDFLGDFSQRQWGDCTRAIITVGGGVSGTFDVGPVAGTHLGFGVFATDEGANLQPVSYAVDAVLVDLFQAAPGDTDGNRKVEGADILNILQAGLFGDGVTPEAVWGNGDFNGDHKVSGEDILMLLQTGLFGDGTYEGNLCDPPAKSASIKTGWISQFEAVRHGKPPRHSRPQRAVDELMAGSSGWWLVDGG